MRTKWMILLGALAGLALSSCNTVAGFGKDTQRLGQGLENTGEGREW